METKIEQPNEGEGNRTAARRYDEGASHHASVADTKAIAQRAAEELDELLRQLDHFSVGMLVTQHHSGRFGARPMYIADRGATGTVRLVTTRTSEIVDEIREQPQVVVTFQNAHRYLSMTGHAEVIDQPGAFASCWKEGFRLWFPEGPSSPEGVVLRIAPFEAEYWDQSGLRSIRFLMQAALSYIQGRPLQDKRVGKHASIALTAPSPRTAQHEGS